MVMNEELQAIARKNIKEGLAKCSDGEFMLFKKMYSFQNLEADINSVVDAMPAEKLSWAMEQVSNTLRRKVKEQSDGSK